MRSRANHIHGDEVHLPGRFVSPLGFLGMLTFVIFIILGITGALLMLCTNPYLTGRGIASRT